MKLSQQGLDLIKRHEGLKLKAYICPAGIPTIGYGHTRTAQIGGTITEQQAEELLKQDVSYAEVGVYRQLPNLKQNQFDALVSFVFNVGYGNFQKSTLLKRIKEGAACSEIKYQFSRWNKGGGKVLAGLTKRREDESNLYCNG